ncbi:copia [Lasius niger]|uniref:Copia n=1 Tax=Lasius niger TaxID=67767 RepID=A0A0J7NMA2_LASNI|nr:copia [Lasius niger]
MYRVYIPETGKIRSDCDVKFDENKIGYESLNKWDKNDQTNNRNLIIVGLNSINEDEDDDMEQFDEGEANDEGRRIETESSEYEDAILEESDEDGMQNENDNEEL